MHDEPMKDTLAGEMDERLIGALESQPAVQIPADFAARVASKLPERKSVRVTPTHYGRRAMVACMVALGVVLLVGLARHSVATPAAVQVTGWILYAQFLGLVIWLGTRGELLRRG